MQFFLSTFAGLPGSFPKGCLNADDNADADAEISKWPLIKQVMMTISNNQMEGFCIERNHENKIATKQNRIALEQDIFYIKISLKFN